MGFIFVRYEIIDNTCKTQIIIMIIIIILLTMFMVLSS